LSEAEKRHHLGHWRFCVVSRDLPRGRSGSVFAQPRASLAVRARRNAARCSVLSDVDASSCRAGLQSPRGTRRGSRSASRRRV